MTSIRSNPVLVTFADGDQGYLDAKRSLAEAALASNYFSRVETYDLARLADSQPNWYDRNKNFISKNPRGFGYWIWKPTVLLTELSKLSENQVLVYADAGCQINPRGSVRMKYYLELTKIYGMLCFYLNGPNYSLEHWTKRSLLERFAVGDKDPMLGLPQVEAGVSFYIKSKENVTYIETWMNLSEERNYHYLDDSPSETGERARFIEHRHDQSIFSLIHYKFKWGKSIRNENYFPREWSDNFHPATFPWAATRRIRATRPDLTGMAVLPKQPQLPFTQ